MTRGWNEAQCVHISQRVLNVDLCILLDGDLKHVQLLSSFWGKNKIKIKNSREPSTNRLVDKVWSVLKLIKYWSWRETDTYVIKFITQSYTVNSALNETGPSGNM